MASIPMYLNFCKRFGGRRALLDLIEALDNGTSQKELAKRYKIDKGQLSRYIASLTTRTYHLKAEIKEHIRRELHEEERPVLQLLVTDQNWPEEDRG